MFWNDSPRKFQPLKLRHFVTTSAQISARLRHIATDAIVPLWTIIVWNALGLKSALPDSDRPLHFGFSRVSGTAAVDNRSYRSTDYVVRDAADSRSECIKRMLPAAATLSQGDEADQSGHTPRLVLESF